MFNCSSGTTVSVARAVALSALAFTATCGGDTGTPPIVVIKPPAVAFVDVTPAQRQLNVGETVALSAVVRDQARAVLTGRVVTWSSSTTAVARVDATSGLVTAVGAGTASIAAASEGIGGIATVVVFAPVASVAIDSTVPPLYVGRTTQLKLAVRDAGNNALTDYVAQWSSSATAVATVSSTGVVSGISVGLATITATVNGISSTRVVLVQAIPSLVLSISPSNAFLPRGVPLALTVTTADFDGNPISGVNVTYTSNDPSVATVAANGVVVPVGNGAATITASANGVAAEMRLIVMDPRQVAGQVITADDGAPSDLAFYARVAPTGQRYSATVDASTGRFTLTIPSFDATGPLLDFYVDTRPGVPRRYHAAFVRLTPGLVPANPRILLIPKTVTPDSGTYKGVPTTVNLNDAFTAVCTNTADANCQSYWPSYWISGIKMWPDVARPIPLAFDRTTGTITDADSVALWSIITTMEADLGRRLYAPAMFTGATSGGFVTGMMLVSRDASVAPFAGYTNWSWDGQGMLYQAKTRLANASYFANSPLASHELTHGLGFHHTCRWATVMGGYGCASTARFGSGDVAYFHLAQMVRAKTLAFGPTWSINESLQGARVIELGLPAADAIPRDLLPLLSRAGLPGSLGAP